MKSFDDKEKQLVFNRMEKGEPVEGCKEEQGRSIHNGNNLPCDVVDSPAHSCSGSPTLAQPPDIGWKQEPLGGILHRKMDLMI